MKIKIKAQKRRSTKEVLLFVALFCVFSTALLEHVSIAIPEFSPLKFPILYVGGCCILLQIGTLLHRFLKKKYFYILLAVLCFCGLILVSALANRSPRFGVNPMRTSLRIVLYLLELFSVTVWVAETGKARNAINFLFWYILILVIATDLLLFTEAIVFGKGNKMNYLIGTKFSVSYLHLYLLSFWFMRGFSQEQKRWKMNLLVLLTIVFNVIVSVRVDCMTGVIGSVLLMILLLFVNRKKEKGVRWLCSPTMMLALMSASIVFPFVVERVLSIPFITYLVEDIFGRDLTLTGRLSIFKLFGKRVSGHFLWGFGYGNGNPAAESLFRCANAQNALLQWILQSGIPVTVMLAVVILMIFKKVARSERKKELLPVVALLYVIVALGTVETTFNLCFFLWQAILLMVVYDKRTPVVEPETP